MRRSASQFWHWFQGFSHRLPGGEVPDPLQDELLSELHSYDGRLYFLISTSSFPHELIITAEGDANAFEAAETLVDSAPKFDGWRFVALKPPMGFDSRFRDGPIDLDVSRLWFLPLKSADDPAALAIQIGFPDADFVLRHQSVDAAYTILETAIGERSCTEDIAQVVVDDLPDSPAENGYLELPRLPDFIAFLKRRRRNG